MMQAMFAGNNGGGGAAAGAGANNNPFAAMMANMARPPAAAGAAGAAGGAAGAPGVTPSAARENAAIMYRDQIRQLAELGFTDSEAVLSALIATGGHVEAAVNILLG